MGDLSAEPSMEEILSSIKRIIAEEGEAPGRPRRSPPRNPGPSAAVEEVLELSDPMPATPAAAELTRRAQAAEAISIAPRIASRWHEPVEPDPVEPAPVAAQVPEPVPTPGPEAPIASPRTTEASRGSLDSLSRLIVKEGAADTTLEGLVREMLRPMLREWLDAQLPAMVEAMVAREIARITHERG